MRCGFLLFSAEPLEERFNLYELKRTHPSLNPFEPWLGWCEAIMSREKEKDAMIGWRAGERTKDGTVDMTAQNIAWGSTTRNSLITTRFNQMFVFKEERMWDRNKAPCYWWSIQIQVQCTVPKNRNQTGLIYVNAIVRRKIYGKLLSFSIGPPPQHD